MYMSYKENDFVMNLKKNDVFLILILYLEKYDKIEDISIYEISCDTFKFSHFDHLLHFAFYSHLIYFVLHGYMVPYMLKNNYYNKISP